MLYLIIIIISVGIFYVLLIIKARFSYNQLPRDVGISIAASRWSISHRPSSVACLENIVASYKVSRSVWRMTGRRWVIQYSTANFFLPRDAYDSPHERDPSVVRLIVSSRAFMGSRRNITLLGGSPPRWQIPRFRSRALSISLLNCSMIINVIEEVTSRTRCIVGNEIACGSIQLCATINKGCNVTRYPIFICILSMYC